jgi:uncharacterized membrane protein YadS
MPFALVKAAFTSSSAFFIEAAAKTVRLLSCANAICGASHKATARSASLMVKDRLCMAVLQHDTPEQREDHAGQGRRT